jgi:hypothetical protein
MIARDHDDRGARRAELDQRTQAVERLTRAHVDIYDREPDLLCDRDLLDPISTLLDDDVVPNVFKGFSKEPATIE